MTGHSLTIDVVGLPAPQGSKRAFVVNGRAVMTESSKKVKPWRQDVAAAVRETTDNLPGFEPFTGPVLVSVVFYLPRPGYHFGTGRNAGVLKATAPTFVDKKPDCDKLLRSVLDALPTSGVIRDDAQVAALTGIKEYANAATGARITIRPLNPSPAVDTGHGRHGQTPGIGASEPASRDHHTTAGEATTSPAGALF